MTDQMRPAPVNIPRYSPIPQACEILDFKRSKMYELAGAGAIRIIKVGGRSLVDMQAALAYMATLPLASIAPTTKTNPR